jgi:hypothetical protein
LTDVIELCLFAGNLQSDINAFIETEVHKLLQFSGGLAEEVRQALIDGANGMFLWVSFVLEDLKKSTNVTPQAIRRALKSLPSDLPGVYTNILRKIRIEDKIAAQTILQWVVWAVRPLTIQELTIAMAILPEHTSMFSMQDNMYTDLRKFLQLVFGPLLRIEEDDTIHLFHNSAKDFLSNMDVVTDADSSRSSLSTFSLASGKSNFRLAMACLTYLSFDECEDRPVAGQGVSERDVKQNIEIRKYKLPFLDYAATHWPEHTSQAGQGSDEHQVLCGAFRKLAQFPHKTDLAYQLLAFSRNQSFEKTTPLQIAASLGLITFVDDLLAHGADINASSGIYHNALLAAAVNGHWHWFLC